MRVIINETVYTKLKNLSYEPECDVTGMTLAIDGFEVDIYTEDDIPYGEFAELRDDMNGLWANYWVEYAEHVNDECVHVRARSPLELLDRVILPEVMYTSATAEDVFDDVFNTLGQGYTVGIDYEVAPSIASKTVKGFCPEQTARERLQWVCLATGAYVRTCFCDGVLIEPVSVRTTDALIPMEKTFWKPQVSFDEYVTGLSVTGYDFTQGSASQAELLADDMSYSFPLPWIADENISTLSNNDAPAGAPVNVVEVSEIYLLRQANVDEVLTRLSRTMFSRMSVSLDVINNREYYPGQFIRAYIDEDTIVAGYITRASFRFGVQARSTLELVSSEVRDSAALTILYTWRDTTIKTKKYTLPVGYSFSIANPYIDKTDGKIRRVYRPMTAAATGTMVSGGMSVIVQYERALEYQGGVLQVLSVDDVSITGGTVNIG